MLHCGTRQLTTKTTEDLVFRVTLRRAATATKGKNSSSIMCACNSARLIICTKDPGLGIIYSRPIELLL